MRASHVVCIAAIVMAAAVATSDAAARTDTTPGSRVTCVTCIGDTALVATATGVAAVHATQRGGLRTKADNKLDSVYPGFDLYGFIAETGLARFGKLSSFIASPSDNSGFYTSQLVISEALRFAATGNATAQRNAWAAFEAMQRLFTVTGIPGYPARGMVPHPMPTGTHATGNRVRRCAAGGSAETLQATRSSAI